MPRVKPEDAKRKFIDWNCLKVEFMRGPYKTLKEFALDKEMNVGTIRNRCSGWVGEKEAYHEMVFDLAAVQCTLDEDVRTAAEMNIVHVRLWDKFLGMVEESFADQITLRSPEGIRVAQLERLASIMERAQKGQRLALNMDKETRDAKGMLSEISDAINAAKAAYDETES